MSGDVPLPYFYRLSPPTGHYELAALEFQALTGDRAPRAPAWDQRDDPTDVPRIARAGVGVDVGRSAYVTECFRLLAEAPSLEGLLAGAEKLKLERERFCVKARVAGGVEAPQSPEIECAMADAIRGAPDLSRPSVELVVMGRPEEWLLGELVSRTGRGWQGHEQRPHQYSSALPPRIARALVNLVAVPGDRLMDPCCGVGTVLVEAGHMGIEAFGWETNRTVAEHATANLCHHEQGAWMVVGDGRTARGHWDGAVLDLPYGRQTEKIDSVCRGLVEHAADVADLIAVVSIDDLTDFLAAIGCETIGVADLIKRKLTRRVHWATTG